MNTQYQYELVLTRLTLKKQLEEEGFIRITLLEARKEVDPTSAFFQTEVQKIQPNQKTVDLKSFCPFRYKS